MEGLPCTFARRKITVLDKILGSSATIRTGVHVVQTFMSVHRFVIGGTTVFRQLRAVRFGRLRSGGIRTGVLTRRRMRSRYVSRVFHHLSRKVCGPGRKVFFSGRVCSTCSFISRLMGDSGRHVVLVSGCISRAILALLSGQNRGISTAVCARRMDHRFHLSISHRGDRCPPVRMSIFHHSRSHFLYVSSAICRIKTSVGSLNGG